MGLLPLGVVSGRHPRWQQSPCLFKGREEENAKCMFKAEYGKKELNEEIRIRE